jgi:hypothetical protein
MELNEYKQKYTIDDAVGWLCIDHKLKDIYGNQEPQHFASVPHFIAGGENPLDGISVYVNNNKENHYHFVTYGFSELYYNEECVGQEFSKFGFELTFRLTRKSDELNINWVLGLFQNIAKYVFSTGNWFEEYQVLPVNGPINTGYDTQITALAFALDSDLGSIQTPHGEVQFLQMIGITTEEHEEFKKNPTFGETEKLLQTLKHGNELLITDLDRK